ncbi:hypothetical protein B566_EDAN014205 [Ephemera danica]|nr:hypothetical protein B566_EDAN014205 [Ephemera danica]
MTHKPGEYIPSTGDYLEQLTDEVTCYREGSFMSEFVSCGAKNFSAKTAVGGDLNNIKTICKVKGLSLNYVYDKLVIFDTLKLKVLQNAPPTVSMPRSKKSKAMNLYFLLDIIKDVDWDEKGVITISGDRIAGSNIIDLFHDVLRNRKNNVPPIGMESFIDVLKKNNVPLEYIGNEVIKRYISALASTEEDTERKN